MQALKPQFCATNNKFRAVLRAISVLLLLACFYNRNDLSRFSPNLRNPPIAPLHRRIAAELHRNHSIPEPDSCSELFNSTGYRSKCEFLVANPDCDSDGFFYYLRFFYCGCGPYSFFGYVVLTAGLVALFYLLGNTAADYFCCSLERLSNQLNLPPTLAGVTLLPFGNGAPDVFSSIAAFLGSGSGEMGLSTVLGGAVFVTCVVVGVVSLSVSKKSIQIDRKCFVRDVCFFLFSISCLALILLVGKITVGIALSFVLIYAAYALSVALSEILRRKGATLMSINPLLPVASGFFQSDEDSSLCASLIQPNHDDELPHWVWASNVLMYSDYENPTSNTDDGSAFSCSKLCSLLEVPLTIPRRLTIPVIEDERWSKPYAVGSAFFAPLLLASIWNSQRNVGTLSGRIAYLIGFFSGSVLAGLAISYTKPDHPPRKLLLPWVLGGFFMSITWFYLIANELVALLVALGTILGISPSLLAITILAWGNSVGDLISNTALATSSQDGVQIAMSGCYAGPMFNTLIGLGVSMLLGAWSQGPSGFVIPLDASLFYTIGFLLSGLIWALIVLPTSDMRPTRTLGVGLIAIYLMFLCFRLVTAIEW